MIINVYDYSEKTRVRESCIENLVAHVIDTEGVKAPALNIIITNDAHLKNLNKRFLKKNKPTNVIAFPMGEVNEIYVSYDQARTEGELYYFIIHGLLHLLGYEHDSKTDEKAMDKRCREYLNTVFPDCRI
ncbi:rRNA maturation RNAse YbeY [candidate division WOR-3 bacterium]|nr:rRNA maturation RNAse YbeY [candidate division WOR-3 bacterium]